MTIFSIIILIKPMILHICIEFFISFLSFRSTFSFVSRFYLDNVTSFVFDFCFFSGSEFKFVLEAKGNLQILLDGYQYCRKQSRRWKTNYVYALCMYLSNEIQVIYCVNYLKNKLIDCNNGFSLRFQISSENQFIL